MTQGTIDPALVPGLVEAFPPLFPRAVPAVRGVSIVLLAAAFAADVFSPWGTAAVAVYAPVALLAMVLPWRDMQWFALAATALAALGLLVPRGEAVAVDVVQRGAVLATLWLIVVFSHALRAQQTLSQLHKRLAQAMDVGSCFAFDWCLKTDRVFRSFNAHRMFGTEPHTEMSGLGKQFFNRIHPDDLAQLKETLDRLTPVNNTYRVTFRCARPDGTYSVVDECGEAFFDNRGRMERLLGMTADVTGRYSAEEALRQSEERLRLAVDAAGLGTWDMKVATGELQWSERQLALMGVPPEKFGGTRDDFLAVIHPEDRNRIEQSAWRSQREGVDFREEFRVVWPDGSVHWLAGLGRAIRGADGSVQRMVGVNVDITQRKEAEAALRESEARFREIAENIDQAFYVYSVAEQRRLYVSPYFEKLWGYPPPPETDVAASLKAVHPDDREAAAEKLRQRFSGNFPAGDEGDETEGRIIHPDGSVRWIHDRAFAVRRPDGTVERVVGFIQDITALKEAEQRTRQLEAELAHATRVSTLGEMTSGLAHELNQPLAAIENYVTSCRVLLQQLIDVPGRVLSNLDAVTQEVQRAAAIIRRLREFVIRREPHHSSVNINRVIEEVVRLSRSDIWQHGAQVRLDLAPELPLVQGDSIQMAQVVLNLLRNALDAMDEEEAERRWVTITTRRDESAVEVSVQDTGSGLTGAAAQQLFEPFFTTKAHGMGLGLTICQTLVQAHGGRIWAESQPSHGTTVRFTLPIC